MIERLLLMGATGDLTARYLLPALASLREVGRLGDRFQLIAISRDDLADDEYRRWAAEQLGRHAEDVSSDAKDAVVRASSYRALNVADAQALRPLLCEGPVAAYLALPPFLFPAAVSALHEAGLPDGSVVVLEKPFGENLREAIDLNRLLTGMLSEEDIFRVDHFLAMTTVQNLLGTRLANRILEPTWNSAHIAEVEIVWEESLGLEGRASYYDGVGALKDMLQNHLLQMLCLVAMEPPLSLNERDLRGRKVDVLRSIRPLSEEDVIQRTRRGRYTAGVIGDRTLPSYVDEPGVDPARQTETFAEIDLELENSRWPGTLFRLRTGKALGKDRKEVIVRFRPVPHPGLFRGRNVLPNVLRFGLEPENVALELTGIGSRARAFSPLTLKAELQPGELPAYGQLLEDVLNRNPALSIRGDEAEESWRVVEPVLDAWSKNLVPLETYPAGSAGPTGDRFAGS